MPGPALKPSGVTEGNPAPPSTAHVLRVLVARCTGGCESEGTVALAADSIEDITGEVADGRLDWTAPGVGDWLVLPIYTRPTGQIVNMFDDSPRNSPVTDPQSYVVDPFGPAGTQALIAYWEDSLLTPGVREGLAISGGAIFEDSLELKAAQYWTGGLEEEFQRRRGYSVVPWLPILIDHRLKTFTSPAEAAFTLDDADLTQRVRADWDRTLAELWQQNHLEPMRNWARSLGLIYRSQAYGGPVDSILAAATTGQPEGESLGFGAQMDKFRALRAGRDIGGGNLLSDEMGAFYGAYDTSWTAKMLPAINRNFAAGVNQLYLHGYAYADAPGATWPGFAPFGTLFAEPWNAMQPGWQHITDVTGYLTRVQMVLQQGHNRTDIAVRHPDLDLDGGYLADEGLLDQGYTIGYLSPATLDLPAAVVRDGVLDPEGAAFRVLVLNNATDISAETLRRIGEFARAGLPVIVAGEAPERAPGLHEGAAADAETRQLAADLLALPNVLRAEGEDQLPAALTEAGLAPRVAHARPARLRHIHRQTDAADFHYVFNDGDSIEALDITLPGTGIPWRLDPWSGTLTRLALYEARDNRTTIPLRLTPGQTAILALRQPGAGAEAPVHAVATTAEAVIASADGLALRVSRAGDYTATLSDGRQAEVVASLMPAPVTLSQWALSVESREPGETATRTSRRRLPEVQLDGLVPWSGIGGLEDISGIGTYRARVSLGPDWAEAAGACLRLGGQSDLLRIRINGEALAPVDPFAGCIDLGPRLRPGENLVEIELVTTLNNVLLATDPDAFTVSHTGPRQRADYGLTGPVSIEPYRDIPVDVPAR